MALQVQPEDPTSPSSPPLVSVPSRDDARRCAAVVLPGGGCTPTVVSFDPPDGTTLIAFGGPSLTVRVGVTPGVLDGHVPQLTLHMVPPAGGGPVLADVVIDGHVERACRDRVVFPDVITPPPANPAAANGVYVVSLVGYAGTTAEITVALGPSPPLGLPVDSCALTLAAGRAAVVPA
jgi:hypothetical protein